MLALRDVTKIYPTLRRALDGVSLDVGEGVFGLLGPNGAGKSTLMTILAAAMEFERGSATLDGIDVRRRPAPWRAKLGVLPQSFDFLPQMTGLEVLEQAALLSGRSPRSLRGRMNELLERVNLVAAARREAATYSQGMKQRLGAAAAFLCEPRLVLLDEPTAGLDPEERVFFRELLAEQSRGRIVILSTHIVGDVERCCDALAVIDRGRVVYEGSPRALAARAQGRTWEGDIDRSLAARLAEERRLVSLKQAPASDGRARPRARLLADERPGDWAQPAEPTLEDGYLALVGIEAQAGDD